MEGDIGIVYQIKEFFLVKEIISYSKNKKFKEWKKGYVNYILVRGWNFM